MKNNTICTICARGGSKGVKNKNIRDMLGKPLIVYSIEQAIKSELFYDIVVSTDSDDIARIAEDSGAKCFFKRPKDLATDEAGKLPVIRHALLESENFFKKKFDYLVDLDATSPLRLSQDIKNSFDLFIKNKNEILLTAMPARRSPYFNQVEEGKNGVNLVKELNKKLLRRQDAPKVFDMNASIYIWKRDALLSKEGLFGEKTGLYIMPEERSIDIDSELDFEFVEFLMRKNLDAQK